MKKLLLLLLILILTGAVGASTVESENVTVDLEDSEVTVDVFITEMTSEMFSYTTSFVVEDEISAVINGQEVECEVEHLQIGSVIECPLESNGDVTANIEFSSNDIVESRNGLNIFNYRKTFSSLTEEFRMEVILPAGSGIIDQNRVSTPTVLPEDYEIGSTGRRITINWVVNPSLGDSEEFRIMYEGLSEGRPDYRTVALFIAGFLLLLVSALVLRKKINRRNVESIYSELSEDEAEIIDLIRENDGEILQKEAVDSSDYSKAKISELVSSLEEKEIIVKEKEGRSNKIRLSDKYSL